jgi:N-acetylneuraminic acid mutarotase
MTDVRDRFRAADDLAVPDLWPEIRRRAAQPGDAPPWDAAPRTGRLVAGLVAFALFLGGVVLATRALVGDEPSRPAPAADPWAGMPDGWTRLADPPVARSDAAAVWTDDRLILWGGGTDYNANFFADGFVFDPLAGGWTPMSDGPLTARAEARGVWTGSEVLIWGGYGRPGPLNDGAAYDPAADTWRPLPPAPWELPWPAAHAWTGSELVLFGSTERSLHEVSGMAYDPEADAWRVIASAPMALNQANAVWTGDEVIVYGSGLSGRNIAAERWARGMAYDPAADSWRLLPEYQISPQASWADWTGTEMLVWDYETNSALYDPATNTWRQPNPMPMHFSECYPRSDATDEVVFASFCGQTAQFDIAQDRWEDVAPGPIGEPTTPQQGAVPLAADDVILVLFAEPSEPDFSIETEELWAYRPS